MLNSMPVQQLTFAPETREINTTRAAAPAGAAGRFEQLLYAPDSRVGGEGALQSASSGLRQYIEQLSHRWESGQSALKRISESGQFTSKDLVLTQMQMINCALDVEVSSKCASMFENGVQTLIQRGG